MLSLTLIVGYFITSLFFLNRAGESGKQAESFGMTVERTNAVIQQITQLETSAYSYVITKSRESEAIYVHKKVRLLEYVTQLKDHCYAHHIASAETKKLNRLISQRISTLDNMMLHDSMSTSKQIQEMSFGNETTLEILNTLKKIRSVNSEMRESNQLAAKIANRNALIVLSFFGVIMFLIVFISFFKMRKEIQKSERYLREINQINIELSSMNENLENFAYVASHDLNEPLRKIKTFGDLIEIELANENVDHNTIVAHVNRMQAASTRMQELIEDLLSYSRISKQYDIKNKINLNIVLKDVISDLEFRIQENSAVINIHDLPDEIYADEIQMRQLFQNLISNAIKFKQPNLSPVVDIKSEIVSSSNIDLEELNSFKFNEFWKISISDNGIGFDDKYADKIFAIFQRLHGRSAYEGTGIGLSICKKITENHKGTIIANAIDGQGSTFTIYLPIK
ncbi:sensor histidine kinase [Brumimicrobium mesophilum]|uniref:sensor histidine kinase n=1 Tax=Brumimicrobium mesophilum TaxID=392717 RepID=UPI00131D48C3|nr:ATP-binding protein [Brumimicrobium mesophilum]